VKTTESRANSVWDYINTYQLGQLTAVEAIKQELDAALREQKEEITDLISHSRFGYTRISSSCIGFRCERWH